MKQNFKISLQQYGMAVLPANLDWHKQWDNGKSPANPNKVLRYAFPVAETVLILPQFRICIQRMYCIPFSIPYIFYDYLASPAKLIPNAAAALPEVSADGLTYTIRLKRAFIFPRPCV